jgi:hypothetical protein
MSIRIKRSSGDAAPSTLASGQLAYSEGSTNGGTLYYGEIGGTVREIGGRKYVDKLNNLSSTDISDFATAVATEIGNADLADLGDVQVSGTIADGQVLTWNSSASQWENTALPSGVTAFTQLNDAPNSYTAKANYWVRVNSAANALEFTQDVDDGTF